MIPAAEVIRRVILKVIPGADWRGAPAPVVVYDGGRRLLEGVLRTSVFGGNKGARSCLRALFCSSPLLRLSARGAGLR